MPRSKFDLEYNEYLNRREAAGFGRVSTPDSKPSGKFVPKSAEPKPKTPKKVDPSLLKGDGSYDLPNNVYKPSGYREKPVELGEDPLSTIRTLRNNLRRRGLLYEREDLPVKAHLCETAINELTHAEGELISLGQRRSNALLVGDNSAAQDISKKMEDVKEKAVRNAYADLIMDNDEMHAFGVDSKWTPDHQPRPPSPKYVRPKTPEDYRFKPRSVPRVRERPQSESRPRSVKRSTMSQRAKTPEIGRTSKIIEPYNPEVKRNERLYPNGFPDRGGFDDPYDLPDYSGICQFCDEGGRNMGTKAGQEEHYATNCMMMNRCRFCGKVLLVSDVTAHQLGRCSFLKNSMVPCSKCGLAMDRIDKKDGVDHPLCRGRKPPDGAQWCPLCAVAVSDNKESWREHLTNNCYSNPRRMGIEENPEPEEEEEDLPPRGRGGPGGNNDNGNGRMIDANKLVKALQEVQAQKKAAAKAKKQPASEAAPTSSTPAPATASTK